MYRNNTIFGIFVEPFRIFLINFQIRLIEFGGKEMLFVFFPHVFYSLIYRSGTW